ncbi:MAG: Crp/Fnr family transcriptional regulator [Thermodesulfobacteriota bacterium]
MSQTIDLNASPLFQGLEEGQLQEIESICRWKRYWKDQTIFSQGDRADGFYVVQSGRVRVYKLSPDGKEQILQIFSSGQPIGEVPVFAGKTFPAHAQALEDCELLFLPRDRLRDVFARDPSLAMNMLAVLAERLREFTRTIEDLTLKELPSRLATYLMHLQDESGGRETVELDVSKGTLAKILGTTQETLSRVFKRMSDESIIRVERRSITILDDAALEDLAEGFRTLA